MEINKIAIIGAGGWGLALANIFSIKHDVCVWVYEKSEYDYLVKNYESETFLKDIKINKEVNFSLDIQQCVKGRDTIIVVVPSFALKAVTEQLSKHIEPDSTIIIATKGLDIEKMKTMSSIMRKSIKGTPILTLSGPSHAEEVARKIPTAIVIAGRHRDRSVVIKMRDMLMISPVCQTGPR